MRITRNQLRKIILSEIGDARARDDVAAGSGRDDLEGDRRPELDMDESDDAAADDDAAAEGEPMEENRRLHLKRRLRKIVRENSKRSYRRRR
jgi:hypothetical protein